MNKLLLLIPIILSIVMVSAFAQEDKEYDESISDDREITETFPQNHAPPSINMQVFLDKSTYSPGDTIYINGSVDRIKDSRVVAIQVSGNGWFPLIFDTRLPNADGSFSFQVTPTYEWRVGEKYNVQVSYSDATKYLVIDYIPNPTPPEPAPKPTIEELQRQIDELQKQLQQCELNKFRFPW